MLINDKKCVIKVRHFAKRYCSNIDIKLVFSCLVWGILSLVGSVWVWYTSFCMRAVVSAMSAGLDTKFWEHSPFGRVTLKMYLPAPVFTRQKVTQVHVRIM